MNEKTHAPLPFPLRIFLASVCLIVCLTVCSQFNAAESDLAAALHALLAWIKDYPHHLQDAFALLFGLVCLILTGGIFLWVLLGLKEVLQDLKLLLKQFYKTLRAILLLLDLNDPDADEVFYQPKPAKGKTIPADPDAAQADLLDDLNQLHQQL